MATIQEVLAAKKPTRRSVLVSKDDTAYDAYRALEREHKLAEKQAEMSNDAGKQRRAKELAKQMLALAEQIEATKVEFIFESIGRAAYAQLLEDHPPSKQDEADDIPFDADTFPPALIAACCVEPEGMDLAAATTLWRTWSDAECTLLLSTAIACNRAIKDPPFIRPATGGTEDSERRSTTAPVMGSLTASS